MVVRACRHAVGDHTRSRTGRGRGRSPAPGARPGPAPQATDAERRCRDMRRIARENAPCALIALAGCAVLAWLGLYGFAWNDYDNEARAAFDALVHGHVEQFLRLAPAYGGSLVERAPFALIPGLWGGGELAVYRMVALPCLLASALLGVWLVARMRGEGRPALHRALALAVCVANPITLRALEVGHPEELLGACLCVAAVLLASEDRGLWAGAALGLAIATKEWALLAAAPVLLALPARRQREQNGCGGKQSPLLGGDRQSQRCARPEPAVFAGEQHGRDAQARAEQLLGVSDFQRAQRDRVGDAHGQRERAVQRRATFAAHARDEPHAEQRRGEQAGQGDHAVDGQLAASPQARDQRERRALDERAAVGRGDAQELLDVAVHECVEGRARLVVVVVPGKAVQPQPGEHGTAGQRDERAWSVLACDSPHISASALGVRCLRRGAFD